jgi:hypothetical protein
MGIASTPLFREFVYKMVRRIFERGTPRLLYEDSDVEDNFSYWLGYAYAVTLSLFEGNMDLEVQLVMATKGEFGESVLVALKAQLGEELFGRVQWVEESKEEMHALSA